MDWPTPTLAEVLRARAAISPYLRPTPTIEAAALGAQLGCRVFLKCEHLTPTGAFKVRGGINLIASLTPDERARGVLAVSTGNHAQSVAYAARLFGVRAIIYMPEAANPLKIAATRALGAEVVLAGHDFDASRLLAEAHAAREGLRYIHSSDEPLLIAGVGTYALELLEAVPDLDAIFVPVGGGSGVIATATVARAVNPAIRLIGVQAAGAPALYLSWKAGRRVETETIDTFAEGLATRQPFALPLELIPRLVDELMLVSDDDLRRAIVTLLETTRQVAEGAGAAALAGATLRRDDWQGKKIGLVISGGNITMAQLREILGE